MHQNSIERLAELIRERNAFDVEIARLIRRPALLGHIGEWIAQKIFDLRLEPSANQAGFDGRFGSGPLGGKTVNVKWYGMREGLLDINPNAVPDFYLVMTGPKAVSSRGGTRPCVIDDVFLFNGPPLMERLRTSNIKIGVATSVREAERKAAKIYPERAPAALLDLTEEQRRWLALFGSGG